MQQWVIFAIIAGLASNAFNFFSRFILKGNDDATVYAWYFETFRCVVFLLFSIFDFKIILTGESLLLFIFLGLTEWIAAYFVMKMHRYSHLSISTILSRTRLIWVPVIAFVLLREQLQVREYIGILILFFGIAVTVSPAKLFVDKGTRFAALASFAIALNIVITKIALPFASNSMINAFSAFPSVFLFPLFMKKAGKRLPALFYKKNVLLKSFAISINIISAYFFILALRLGNASKVTAIYQGMMIVSVAAGILFLNERKDAWKKIIGAGIVLIGVLLLG